MEWEEIKSKIYYLDGSLRDVYVNNVTSADWEAWVDFVNKHYKISFHIYASSITTDKIDFSIVQDYWKGNKDNSCMGTIFVDNISINTYFFDDCIIENDLTPTEIHSISDHNKILQYMKGVSNALCKKVVLTSENDSTNALITVYNNEVKFIS